MSRASHTNVVYLRDRMPPVLTDYPPVYPPPRKASPTLLVATWVDRSRFATAKTGPQPMIPDQHRAMLLKYVRANDGALLGTIDGSVLARFATPAAAVQAAIQAQRALESLNHEHAEQTAGIKARIGVHLESVSETRDLRGGEEMTVAARLAALAVPDGICVSKPVYDAIRNDWQIASQHLGLLHSNGLPGNIRAYLLKPAGITLRDKLHYSMVKSLNCLRHKLKG